LVARFPELSLDVRRVIAEHWDVVQEVPEATPGGTPMV
jgi:predicted SnoaL-like aldol condensation-catalyzing enzyme